VGQNDLVNVNKAVHLLTEVMRSDIGFSIRSLEFNAVSHVVRFLADEVVQEQGFLRVSSDFTY
jgi:hypothetical protein